MSIINLELNPRRLTQKLEISRKTLLSLNYTQLPEDVTIMTLENSPIIHVNLLKMMNTDKKEFEYNQGGRQYTLVLPRQTKESSSMTLTTLMGSILSILKLGSGTIELKLFSDESCSGMMELLDSHMKTQPRQYIRLYLGQSIFLLGQVKKISQGFRPTSFGKHLKEHQKEK